MRDRLFVHGLKLFGRHGVLPAERSLGQRFVVDVDAFADVARACRSDRFEHTLDYVRVFEVARDVVQGPPCELVEHVAQRIADGVLNTMPAVTQVRVRVTKPHVALPAVLDGVGVEIWRRREAHDAHDANARE